MANETFGPAHLSFLQTQVVTPLTVFVPPVRRYLPKQYVEVFRDKGSLRLSTFETFRRHANEQQGDRNEGHAFNISNDPKRDRSFGAYTIAGHTAYVLSLTSRTTIAQDFGDDFFEIVEPVGFCAEVARMIPGCAAAMIGQCIYVDSKLLRSPGRLAPTLEELQVGDGSTDVSLEKVLATAAKMGDGPRQYFLKDRRFEDQAEIRMIWEVGTPVEQPIFIEHLQLAQFCTPQGVS